MAIRDIIEIDEELCDGCGQCVPSCAEGALQVIRGKARLVSEVLCDGLGACLGHCPTGALKVIKRTAAGFDEAAVAQVTARHRDHRPAAATPHAGGCPGSRVQVFDEHKPERPAASPARHPANLGFIGFKPQAPAPVPLQFHPAEPPVPSAAPASTRPSSSPASRLRQWPVQLHLLPPTAPFFNGRHVLLAADCVPVAVADFHESLLDGRSLAIACPKLDQHQEMYVEKLAAMMDDGGIESLQVAIMEVPCCAGLVRLAQQAAQRAQRKVPIEVTRFSIRGEKIG